ncbi:hypothetical protein FPV67DRAFT_1780361 [Lyophyllum atratum]|nr:hypothetical protein FPV67DRAFT_1780361 [Lyophyllum atratum]
MVAFTERPTLPPLHTLGLPNPSARMIDSFHELSYDNPSCPRLHIPNWRRARQVSTSSSMTSRSPSPPIFDSSSSRSSSPSTASDDSLPSTPVLSISPLSSRLPHTTTPLTNPLRFRLEPCTLDEAQAIVLIPPPCAPPVPSLTNPTPTPQKKQQALLLLGPSMQYFRHPQRQLAKGARIHPYRIMPSQRKDGTWTRRASAASIP